MRRICRALLLLVLFALAVGVSCARRGETRRRDDLSLYPERIEGVPGIRILVREGLSEALVSVDGPYELRAEPFDPQSPPLGVDAGPVSVTVRPTVRGVKLGRPEAPYGTVAIVPAGATRITVDGVDYGGSVLLIRQMPEKAEKGEPLLDIAVRLDMEQYLAGVVPHEMPSSWPIEALRAQAVAARTYALYKTKTRSRYAYDVKDTTASQVWKPSDGRNRIANLAVNSTRGIVLTDQFRLFPAYYSAQCGGETKDGVNVFISRHINPLTGVLCPFCRSSDPGVYCYDYDLPVGELKDRLARDGHAVGTIRRIRALDERGRTLEAMGRVYDVTIESDGPEPMLTLPMEKFRQIAGPGRKQLASSYFEVSLRGGVARFRGRGHGHGVGLCQYGARYLAEHDGYDWRAILQHYYQGNTLVRLW